MFTKIFKLKIKLFIAEVKLLYMRYVKIVILALFEIIADLYNRHNDRR